MPPAVAEWFNLILRWIHVFAGILWIGQNYYFAKARSAAHATGTHDPSSTGAPNQVWMVHSGGFFVAER